MMSLSDDEQADISDAVINTFRYSDDILNINNIYFGNMVSQIYHSELQINKVNTFDTIASFWTRVCPFQMILFLPKFTINVTILSLELTIFDFKMV